MKKKTREEIQSIVSAELSSAVGYLDSEITQDREEALERYLGEPLGNEREGFSQVQSRDVHDVVEGMMPGLVKTFHGVDETVECVPVTDDDVISAREATDYLNHVYNVDNDGLANTEAHLKDALIQITGIQKVSWRSETKTKRQTLVEVSEAEFALEAGEDGVEVEAYEEAEVAAVDPVTGQEVPLKVISARLSREIEEGRTVVEVIPPEEFVISKQARSRESANLRGHRALRPRHYWTEMGFDEKLIRDLPAHDDLPSGERDGRHQGEAEDSDSLDPMNQEVIVTEAYVRIDGKLMLVWVGGSDDGVLLEDPVEVDDDPFSDFCPIAVPHRFYGLSVADSTKDIQEIKSHVLRQMLDGLNLANAPAQLVDIRGGRVDIGHLLNRRVGQAIPVRGDPRALVAKLEGGWDGVQSIPMLEWMDRMREERTGLTRRKMGADPDALKRQDGAAGAIIDQQNSDARVEFIALKYAQALRRTFKLILANLIKYQDFDRVVRIRNKDVTINPQTWNPDMDVRVTVGFGMGDKGRRLQHLNILLQQQMLAIEKAPQLCQWTNIYNTLEDQIKAMDLQSPDRYWRDPEQPLQPGDWQGPEEGPDSDMAKVEVAAKKAEAEIAIKQQQAQADQQLELQKQLIANKIAQQELEQKSELRRQEMELEAQLSVLEMQYNAATRSNEPADTNIQRQT
ncbi:MAG: hypothetical protein AAGH60_14395 [Pseudomonadota bacterium]